MPGEQDVLSLVDSNAHVTAPSTERSEYATKPLAAPDGEADEVYEPSVEELIPLMDLAGVEQAFLIASRNHGFDNSYCAEAAERFPGRFATVANIDIYDERAIENIEYWIDERHMQGVRLLGGGRGVAHWIDDARYLGVWQHIDQIGVPVNAQMTRYETLPNTRRLLEQLPELRLTINNLAHVPVDQGSRSQEAKDLFLLAEYPAVYVNVSVEFLEKTLETGSPAEELLRAVLDAYGAQRFLWSAFYPSPPRYPYEVAAEIVRRSLGFLSEDDQRWAAGDAARNLYPSLQAA